MGIPDELDAARERWQRKWESLGLPDPGGKNPTEPGGLARRFSKISTRIVVLPGDPFRSDLEFKEELWRWWGDDRETPFNGVLGWSNLRPTADAAVRFQGHGEEWKTCLALHRNRGVELIGHDFYQLRDGIKALRLVRSVALLWIAMDAQAWVLGHLDVPGPWQVVVALHDTQDSVLGDLAPGWVEPHDIRALDPPRCHEPNVLIVRELEQFPTKPDDVRRLAFDLGGRIEDAWGVKERRFLARTGDSTGEFNPMGWNR
jgi:hypothetical protein